MPAGGDEGKGNARLGKKEPVAKGGEGLFGMAAKLRHGAPGQRGQGRQQRERQETDGESIPKGRSSGNGAEGQRRQQGHHRTAFRCAAGEGQREEAAHRQQAGEEKRRIRLRGGQRAAGEEDGHACGSGQRIGQKGFPFAVQVAQDRFSEGFCIRPVNEKQSGGRGEHHGKVPRLYSGKGRRQGP